MAEPLFGILNVDKPVGRTSRSIVDQIQRLARPNKVGHAGTLDPLASGVLLVCVGRATRLVPYLQQPAKRYRATFLLGRTSDTEDTEGTVTRLDTDVRPGHGAIESRLPSFLGQIMQRPPSFSALKVKGRRAYDLARQGQLVTLAARPIQIHRLEIVAYVYPELTLDITCGSGTYIRSLGRDLAESLNTGAVMSALVRTAIGPFHISKACDSAELAVATLQGYLQPARMAVEHLPRVILAPSDIDSVLHGRVIPRPDLPGASDLSDMGHVAAVDSRGHLVAILEPKTRDRFKPVRTFPQSDDSP